MAKKIRCRNCGEYLPENARICMYCNTKVTKKKISPKLVFVIILWAIVIAALCFTSFYFYERFAFLEIDASQLIKVNIEGTTGDASAYLSLDEESEYFKANATGKDAPLLTDVYDTNDLKKAQDMQIALKADIYIASDPKDSNFLYRMGTESIKASSIDKISEITNGDVLTVTVRYDEKALRKFKIKLTNTTYTVNVSDLNSAESLNPFADISVDFSGTDGYGTAEINTSKCKQIVLDNFTFSITTSSNNGELSNDDTVTVVANCTSASYNPGDSTIEYDGRKYVVSKSSSSEFTVSGLGSVQELDPFENVTVNFSGISPNISVSGMNTDNAIDLIKKAFDYTISQTSNLKLGDVITVNAEYKSGFDDEDLLEKGFTLLKSKRTYIVENVDAYATKVKNIDLTNIKSEMHKQLSSFSGYEINLVNAYFNTAKTTSNEPYNQYFEVYEIKLDTGTIYRIVEADNIYTTAGGELRFTVNENARNSGIKEILIDQFVKSNSNYKTKNLKIEAAPIQVTE